MSWPPKKLILQSLLSSVLCFLSSSCVWRHVTPSHNTPHFTDKNQAEFVCNAGPTGINVTMAYTPIKYLALHANGYSSVINLTGFNYQAEGGLTGYFPMNRFTFGLNVGYGIGSTEWVRWWYAKESSVEPYYAKFNTKKTYLNPYIIHKFAKKPNYWGLSFKMNFLSDYYYKFSSDADHFAKYNFLGKESSYEFIYFIKTKTSEKTFFTLNVGLSFLGRTSDRYSEAHPIAALGLILKI